MERLMVEVVCVGARSTDADDDATPRRLFRPKRRACAEVVTAVTLPFERRLFVACLHARRKVAELASSF